MISALMSELDEATKRRRTFQEAALSAAPTHPRNDVPLLCRAWLELNGADWAWLLLYNHFTDRWELLAADSITDEELELPDPSALPGSSVTQYCVERDHPTFIDYLDNWRAEFEGVEYRVTASEFLKKKGCVAFECVPFSTPVVNPRDQDRPSPEEPEVSGSVCIFYRDTGKRIEQHASGLMLLGRMTAISLMNSYQAQQRQILLDMDVLAGRYLTRVSQSRNPALVRNDYLQELIQLIQRNLDVSYVSVFFRDYTGGRIECLASTGLYDADGNELPLANLTEATYKPGESRTGKCFASGEPYMLISPDEISADNSQPPKFRDMPATHPETLASWVMYPIPISDPSAARDLPPSSPKSIGVIRCAGYRSPFLRNKQKSFDPIQVQTLDFIARQVGPVLETLAINILREQTISITKHDLFAPIQMISDTAEEISYELKHGRTPNLHNLDDLGMAVFFTKNLIPQLDPNPEEMRSYSPIPTLLEADIVARVKNMLRHYAKRENQMEIWFEEFRGAIPSLIIDRELIERVFCNLIINAIKYGDRGSTIRVEPRQVEDGFQVAVKNYGIGVEEDEAEHVFRPNYRSPAAIRRKVGNGLGLTISRAAMRRHGGDLQLSRLKDPTILTMCFPKQLRYQKIDRS